MTQDDHSIAVSPEAKAAQQLKSAKKSAKKPPKPKESIFEIFRTICYALLIAMILRTVLFQPFSIPSGSMKSTLLVGDYLFVSKYSYGYSKYSLPFSPNLFEGRIFFSEPKRGDVVVFRPSRRIDQDYIKRLIGLPGDRIKVEKGLLFVNGNPVEIEQIDDFIEPGSRRQGVSSVRCIRRSSDSQGGQNCHKEQFYETLENGVRHLMLNADGQGSITDNTGEIMVPEGHYFFMGDNRDNSSDSRPTGIVGFVPAENLIGRAEIVVLSTSGAFWEFWKWRSDRFFKIIK